MSGAESLIQPVVDVASVAAAPFTGGLSLAAIPATAAGETAINGGDFGDYLTNMGTASAGAAIGDGIGGMVGDLGSGLSTAASDSALPWLSDGSVQNAFTDPSFYSGLSSNASSSPLSSLSGINAGAPYVSDTGMPVGQAVDAGASTSLNYTPPDMSNLSSEGLSSLPNSSVSPNDMFKFDLNGNPVGNSAVSAINSGNVAAGSPLTALNYTPPDMSNLAGVGAGTSSGSSSGLGNILNLVKGAGALASILGGGTKYPGTQTQSNIANNQRINQNNQANTSAGFEKALNSGANTPNWRTQTNPQIDYYTYGQRPMQNFFNNTNPAITYPTVTSTPLGYATGGKIGTRTPLGTPNPNTGGQGGQDDTIPIQASPGEFVIPADVTSALGDGNSNAGAAQLHGMIKKVRKHKASPAGGLPPMAKSPLAYIGGNA